MDLQEVGFGDKDWIELAQDKDRWRALVNAVMHLQVLQNAGNFLTLWKPARFSKRTLLYEMRKYVSVFPVICRLFALSRHSCRFTALSDVTFLCFMILSTSFSHFTSGRPPHHFPSGEQVIIRLGHLLSSMRTKWPFHFNMLFSSLPNIVCVTPSFSL